MGDMAESWNAHRDYKRSVRDKWWHINTDFIESWCYNHDTLCVQMQDQVRVGGMIDVWPQWLKWHNLDTGERGQCANLEELEEMFLKEGNKDGV